MKNLKDMFTDFMNEMKEMEEYFENLRKNFSDSEQKLIDIIDRLDFLESMRLQLLDNLKKESEEYKELKAELSKKKLDLKFIKSTDLSADLNRLLNTEEMENKVKITVKRNTVKKNVDARYEELNKELKELQDKNAKGELTEAEVARYYLIPELLKEFDNVRI
jgi:chromosome segregation ATPase